MTSRRARKDDLIVFVGPSLRRAEVERLAPCRALPPARQGDLWRALSYQPRAIALVDGVFESQPSVWHREILAALDSGVAVFGGASMGALRAAELWREGMVGVGRIFGWYRDGALQDDSEVALLHAGAEHGFEAFTVPLVNVRHAADSARRAKALTAREAAALVEAAAAIFYQERTWPLLLERVGARWSAKARARWLSWASAGMEDLKSVDARACIAAAADYVARTRGARPSAARPAIPSSLVRRRQTRDGASRPAAQSQIENAAVLDALAAHPDVTELCDRGLRRALLAAWAREQGLTATEVELAFEEREWLRRLGFTVATRADALAASGLSEAELRVLLEEAALERRLLRNASRLVADGPSGLEALAAEARLSGLWAQLASRMSRRR